MQAGEELSFIKPFTGERQIDDKEVERLSALFLSMCLELLNKFPETVRSIERIEDGDFVTVSEGSYKVESSDGSYIHVVIFGHTDDGGLIDVGLSAVEHTNNGVYNGGYFYILQDDGLRRDTLYPDLDDKKDTTHFSMIDIYEENDFMELSIHHSDDEALREAAKQIKAGLEDSLILNRFEQEMGIDQQPPMADELVKLKILLSHAQPFIVPSSDDESLT